MFVSTFDLFKIGIGPSSSHTVGPMRAARQFSLLLQQEGMLPNVARVCCQLYGSLAATGKGHGSDKAIILGLEGDMPESVAIEAIPERLRSVRTHGALQLLGKHRCAFSEKEDLLFLRRERLPHHSNGMRFTAFGEGDRLLLSRTYYSVGGGFVVDEAGTTSAQSQKGAPDFPMPFKTGNELLAICRTHGVTIAEVMQRNELALRTDHEIRSGIHDLWKVMQLSIERGMAARGALPGGLKVERRAAGLNAKLQAKGPAQDGLGALDWINLYAIAVNEENAAGGRIVTAPTNGAAGVLPAVLKYYLEFAREQRTATEDCVVEYFLTAAAIGLLYKENASISGAEVGCQGEVGVACSMAAGALAAVLGGAPGQVENAAEIGMEHHLGMTCDPIGGLVQIPCIERNAVGAVKAVNAARMALYGDGKHYVSLDKVIKTMRQTGADMMTKYKETSRGGLAVHIPEC